MVIKITGVLKIVMEGITAWGYAWFEDESGSETNKHGLFRKLCKDCEKHKHEAEEYKAPIFPEYLKYRDIIYSPKDSNDVFSDILTNCSEMFATIIKQKKSLQKY